MKKSVAVIGLGRFGISVLKTLTQNNIDVIAVDNCKDRVMDASKFLQHCVICDSTKLDNLKELGINNVNHAIVCIGKNIQSSILTLINLKELGVEKVTVRVDAEEYIKVMTQLGADEVIFPEHDFGIDFAKRVSMGDNNVKSYFDLDDNNGLIVFKVKESFKPKTVAELSTLSKFEVMIVTITKNNSNRSDLVSGETLIEPNDTLCIVAKYEKAIKFEDYING